jgi:hypothetical protein
MVKYIIIHNKHEGCYDFPYYEDEAAKIRLTSITINPPKIFMFDNKDQAQDFFEEYINDVDVLDNRCKKGDDVKHIEYCTCGIIELDEEENPILFYNKKNQIFLMEHGPTVFVPPHELKEDIKNFNLTNRLMRKAKTLNNEQRKRYIELGKYCEDCSAYDLDLDEDEKNQVGDKNTDVNMKANEAVEKVKEPVEEVKEPVEEVAAVKTEEVKPTEPVKEVKKIKRIKKVKQPDDKKEP